MKISVEMTKNDLSLIRRLPILSRNAVWRQSKKMKEELLDRIESDIPKAKLVDSTRRLELKELMKQRVRLVRKADNHWEVGVFAKDGTEFAIFLLHEFGGKIQVTEAMRNWWWHEFGTNLQVQFISIDQLNVLRPVLNVNPSFKPPQP